MRKSLRSNVLKVAAAAIVSAIAAAAPSHAAIGDLYAVTGSGDDDLECGGTLSSLYTVDPTDASATLVGPIMIDATQARHITALAMHPSTGVLYAIANDMEEDDGCFDSVLLTVDPATAVATVVSLAEPLPGNIPDMTFDPFGNLYAWSEDGDDLVLIDEDDGTWEIIPSDAGTFRTGLASDSKGRLFLKIDDDLYRVNQYTGEVFDFVAIDRELDNMLAFSPADLMYSGKRTSSGLNLFVVDPETGETTTISSNTVTNISALAFDRGVLTPPVVADLALNKEVDENLPLIGTDVVFTLTLINTDSDGDAENVVVRDVLPDNFFFQSFTGDGSYLDTTGEWTVTVPDFGTAEIEITATAMSDGEWTNSAEVVDSDSYDPDSVPGSGDASADTYDEVSGIVRLPTLFSIDRDSSYLWVVDPLFSRIDVAQELSLSGHSICGGNALAAQPTTGTLFGVLDDCSERRLVTIDPQTADATDVGSFGGTRIAAIAFDDSGTLYASSGNGGSQTRTLFTVDTTDGTLTPECVLSSSSYGRALAYAEGYVFDATQDCTTNCQLVIRAINPLDFPEDPTDPCPGDTFEANLSIEPTAMTVGEIGVDSITFLVSSFNQVYEVTVPDDPGPVDSTFLGFSSHNSKGLAFVDTEVTEANLTVSKSATKSRVKGDKFISYLLQAQNNGPDEATDVVLTDQIPFGTTLVSASNGCGEAGGIVTCEVGTLSSGVTQFYTMIVQVTCKKCSTISNTVGISTDADLYDSPFNNTWQINTEVKGKF
jgi:uncharacterized repeat protein (TIGR01451 family)